MPPLLLPRAFPSWARHRCPSDRHPATPAGPVRPVRPAGPVRRVRPAATMCPADEITEEVERRLRRAAARHAGWLRYVGPLSACGFGLADLFFTGDISGIDNRGWLAVHLAVLAGSLTRDLCEARGRSGRTG